MSVCLVACACTVYVAMRTGSITFDASALRNMR